VRVLEVLARHVVEELAELLDLVVLLRGQRYPASSSTASATTISVSGRRARAIASDGRALISR
jgi:hypothetical protein